MSTITRRSVRRAGNIKSSAPTMQSIMTDAKKAGINYAVRGRLAGKNVAHTVAHFGTRSQAITSIHPTKKATRGRMATVTLFL